LAGSIAVRIRNRLIIDPWIGTGEIPQTVRGNGTRAQAQPEAGFVKIVQTIFPLAKGGLLSRTYSET
jgi:hypothetical protein